MSLQEERARRWWRTRRPVGSLPRAARFVEDVGFALLFPTRGVSLPSLFEAVSDRPLEHLGSEWGPDTERVWGWKDELPLRGLAWYGRFLRGRPSFLSPDLLTNLYPRDGRPEDFLDAGLGQDAERVAQVILSGGPLPSSELRRATGLTGKAGGTRSTRALAELGRSLVITHLGVEQEDNGWPSAVLELTVRAFGVPARNTSPEDRRLLAASRFLDTMIEARPRDLALAFGWPVEETRRCLRALVGRDAEEVAGGGFRANRR